MNAAWHCGGRCAAPRNLCSPSLAGAPLYRGIVDSLSLRMRRAVFFTCSHMDPLDHLEALMCLAWDVPSGDVEVLSLASHAQLLLLAVACECTGDMRLFELTGNDRPGQEQRFECPQRPLYVAPHHTLLLVPPPIAPFLRRAQDATPDVSWCSLHGYEA